VGYSRAVGGSPAWFDRSTAREYPVGPCGQLPVGQDIDVPSYVAFLRAINLGPTRKFAKAKIVEAVEDCGFTDVETYINTGNVRFSTSLRSRAKVEQELERSFRKHAGFEVPTIVMTPAELSQIAADAVEVAALHQDTGAHYVSLLKEAPKAADVKRLEELDHGEDLAVIRGRGAHLLVVTPSARGRLGNATVEKVLGVATNRNLNVVRTLADKWGDTRSAK
jgi:uncharacterized protein (DUF1697 family)